MDQNSQHFRLFAQAVWYYYSACAAQNLTPKNVSPSKSAAESAPGSRTRIEIHVRGVYGGTLAVVTFEDELPQGISLPAT
jgi:hypothetical protein